MEQKSLWQIFSKGLLAENPIFILALSLCPALAVTTTVINGLTMGLTVTFVITTNNVVVSLVRRWVNPKVRVPVYITSIATIVTVAQLVLQAYFPDLYDALGIYLAAYAPLLKALFIIGVLGLGYCLNRRDKRQER